jgi:hypothetical protein
LQIAGDRRLLRLETAQEIPHSNGELRLHRRDQNLNGVSAENASRADNFRDILKKAADVS